LRAASRGTVQRIDTIRVFCDVPENDVPRLHRGDAAIVKPYGFQGKPFTGSVSRFSFSLNPETGAGNFVYTVSDNHITRLAIKIGLTDNGRAEVTAGLSKDTPIVMTFRGAPPPGTAVRAATVAQKS
jgi:hypothetical protein